ncbi:endoplasmin homolog [Aphidius gifuensis]|uniref:endoplasmin homolog n=1 Tax=Aphidius gifuensis TaxID=684658 RepID=UPI001CDCCF3B|nr:endoplasmin homolog [Aphidius gifuensis]
MKKQIYICLALFCLTGLEAVRADSSKVETEFGKVELGHGISREALRTDADVVDREAEAISFDNSNSQRHKNAEKFTFQTEVNRMMKLIINSLYRNKEIFLRELISNASDALDKIRLLSLTQSSLRETNPENSIRIKADVENKILHISDSGVGMTKQDLINNLGTIAKSGTAEFLGKLQESGSNQDANDMIGQFGVGFYSGFLVANKIVVTSKHNDDKQHIWESDSSSYSIVEDPRGDTLKRGTTISLYLKDEASDFLEQDTIKNLIKKYSQFINFPIYLWSSKTIQVEDIEDDVSNSETKKEEHHDDITDNDEEKADNEEVEVEEAPKENEEKQKKMVDKTVWDWEVLNDSKPIWTLKPIDVDEKDYNEFYRAITKDTQDPLAKVHFVAEGEVSFKALLYVPKVQPGDSFNRYGTKADNIKLFVRRVFITDQINDMMPSYLSFIRGIVDSDDLPLNVSRENLQQHKLIKVIKKKLIRKVLDMIKKISKEEYENFWKEYSTNIKLGVIEDAQNRARLAKLLQFKSSKENLTNLVDYVERMKKDQKAIFYIAGSNDDEVKNSPFVERLTKKGYEVLYLTEAVDEYAISAIPMFEDKKFQNVAKEGFTLDDSDKAKKKKKALETRFEPLIKWLGDKLSEYISKAQVSERLTESPCALVASMFGWTGNMERLAISNAHQKADDPQKSYYLNQKKTLEINPRHPLIKELLRRVDANPEDKSAREIATMMFKTATLRSGYMLQETASFAESVELLMRKTLGIPVDEQAEEEDDDDDDDEIQDESTENQDSTLIDENDDKEQTDDHDEL